jgi:hypothetical protein
VETGPLPEAYCKPQGLKRAMRSTFIVEPAQGAEMSHQE